MKSKCIFKKERNQTMKLKKIITLFFALAILFTLVLPVFADGETYKLEYKLVIYEDTDMTEEEIYAHDKVPQGKNEVTGKNMIIKDLIDAVMEVPVDYTFADLRKYFSEKYGGEENDILFMLSEAEDQKDAGAKAYKSAPLCNDGAVIKDAMIKWYGKKNWYDLDRYEHFVFSEMYPSEMDVSDYNNSNNPSTGDGALSVVPVILLSLSAAYCFGRKKKTA
ncbi:MAG: hypothetical protein KBT31_05375 [Firmicutes bacterium]|nr:hypothetical protein [Candidatus Colimorpha enterica]